MQLSQDVFWVSMNSYDLKLMQLELDYPDQLTIIHDSKLEELAKVFRELPMQSHIFLDSVISTINDHPKYKDKQYYGLGKFLQQFKKEKLFSFYLTSTISGFNHKPITDSFDRMIDYEFILKKLASKKDFEGREFKVIGNYYSITETSTQFNQVLYAGMKKRLTPNMVKFFWLVSQGIISKINRTYYLHNKPLGSDVHKILATNTF